MKLKFFKPKATGKALSAPGLTLRAKGQITLNTAAMAAINAEPGEAITICHDEESDQYLLCHWPDGQQGYPVLRALSGKAQGLRFQMITVAEELFSQTAYRQLTLLRCTLDVLPLANEQAPGAVLYTLTLPAGNDSPVKPATTMATQPGVGRGHYDRSTANRKGVNRG